MSLPANSQAYNILCWAGWVAKLGIRNASKKGQHPDACFSRDPLLLILATAVDFQEHRLGCNTKRSNAGRKGGICARLSYHVATHVLIAALASGSQTLRDDCRPRLGGATRGGPVHTRQLQRQW